MAGAEPAIVVEHLAKHFGSLRAVDDVSFSVARGEIFGLLGHNGAGKTTIIRVLTGRSLATSGKATLAGYDISNHLDRVKPLMNVVAEDPNLYERMSGYDNLRFFADLYGAPPARVDELLKRVGLGEERKRQVKKYSSGMKQRLLIARALINSPQILFLDEPTHGLDPAAAREVRQLLAHLSREGATICLTTHYMEEADELCHRVAFLSQGKIVALDTPRELKLRLGQRTAVVLLASREERTIRLDDPADARLLEGWISAGDVLTIHSQEGTLADVFIALAGRPL
jgi:ABC-2 type transport system ATP-binding protein